MRRWLFHIFAGLSLLLMVASCVIWVRSSIGRSDHVWRHEMPSEAILGHTSGKFEFGICVYDVTLDPGIDWTFQSGPNWSVEYDWDLTLATVEKHFVGFDYYAQEKTQSPGNVPFVHVQEFFLIRVPIWLVVLLFALPPLLWLHFFKRRRRVHSRLAKGLCITCGYDLQGNTGNCPECGTKRGNGKG